MRLANDQHLQGLKPKTIKNKISTLKTAIHYAMKWDLIMRDIGHALIVPKVPKTRYRTFSRSELEDRLLPVLKRFKHGLFLRMLAVCGLRTQEAAALPWRDVNFEKGTIRIAQAAYMKERQIKKSGETKEEASIRIIDLDAETLSLLVKHRAKLHKKKVTSLDNLVFPADDGRILSSSTIKRTMQKACAAAGLPYASPHKLRHGVGQIMDEEGRSATQIAETLGHADGTVSEQIYTLSQRHGRSILKQSDDGSRGVRKNP